MYTELIVGKEVFKLNENGDNLSQTLEFSGLASQVPVFVYLIQQVEHSFISMKFPSEEQLEIMELMEELECGTLSFENDSEADAIYNAYAEKVEPGIFNQEIIDLGGVGITIHGEKFTLEYFFDGICPSEKIYTKDGQLLSEISRSKIFISLMNEETLCDFTLDDIDSDNLGINPGNEVEDFIKVYLNEETLSSVGVIFNEFGDNQKFIKAFKRLYSVAYREKNNALRNIVSSTIEEDGNISFLVNMTQGVIDAGLALHPDKQFIYSI